MTGLQTPPSDNGDKNIVCGRLAALRKRHFLPVLRNSLPAFDRAEA